LSQFLQDFLLSIKFKIKHLHPDTRICSPSKSCTGINFLAPIKLCTAILRQCLRAGFIYRDNIRDRMLACTAIAPAHNRNLYPDRQKLRHASLITALVALSS
jgi:hypothetical protein